MRPPKDSPPNIIGLPATNPAVDSTCIKLEVSDVSVAVTEIIESVIDIRVES